MSLEPLRCKLLELQGNRPLNYNANHTHGDIDVVITTPISPYHSTCYYNGYPTTPNAHGTTIPSSFDTHPSLWITLTSKTINHYNGRP